MYKKIKVKINCSNINVWKKAWKDKPDIAPNKIKFFLIKKSLFKSLKTHKINK